MENERVSVFFLRIDHLERTSKDALFNNYLSQLRKRAATGNEPLETLEKELDWQYNLYLNQMKQKNKAKDKRNTEFTVGATLLSILGGVFILAAFVMFGIYYMDGNVKGFLLLAACTALMAVSELWIYKRIKALGTTFTSIGLGGFYISVMVNYLRLKTIPSVVALLLVVCVTVFAIALSRKKNAEVYRMVSIAAMQACLLIVPAWQNMNGNISDTEYTVVIVVAFILNLLFLMIPLKSSHVLVNILHIVLNVSFTISVFAIFAENIVGAVADGSGILPGELFRYLALLAMSLVVTQFLFAQQIRWSTEKAPEKPWTANWPIISVYGCSMFFYLCSTGLMTNFSVLLPHRTDEVFIRLISALILAVIYLTPMFLIRNRIEKWILWCVFQLNLIDLYLHSGNDMEIALFFLVLLLLSKVVSVRKIQILRIMDSVFTTFVCMWMLAVDEPYNFILFAGILISVFCVHFWQEYYATVLTLTLAVFVWPYMFFMFRLPIFVGILFVSMLLFNNVRYMRGKNMVVFNYIMLACQACAYLLLLSMTYGNSYLTYFCMLIFGIATIVICFHERYGLAFKGNEFAIPVFLTYMCFALKLERGYLNSVLMMLVALVCVCIGFVRAKKGIRIYGLVLVLTICEKLVLFDFRDSGKFSRMIVLFVVGVIALIISAIYMVLEHKMTLEHKSDQQTPQNAYTGMTPYTMAVSAQADPVAEPQEKMAEETEPENLTEAENHAIYKTEADETNE